MAGKSEEKNAYIAIQKQAAEVKEAEINSKKKTIDAALEAIAARTKVVEAEKIEATNLAESADKELARALPALEAANDAVDKLEGKYIAEMKSMNVPHQDTHMVMMAVMTFLGQATPWAEIKKVISKPGFKDSLFTFDKENIPQSRLTKVQKFTRMESFNEGHMFAISRAAAALCVWVKAIEEYAQALKVVNPKREKKEAAEAKVKAMEEELAAMQRQFDEMQAELDELQKNYDRIMAQLEEFVKEI
jgi:dynein heavy chain